MVRRRDRLLEQCPVGCRTTSHPSWRAWAGYSSDSTQRSLTGNHPQRPPHHRPAERLALEPDQVRRPRKAPRRRLTCRKRRRNPTSFGRSPDLRGDPHNAPYTSVTGNTQRSRHWLRRGTRSLKTHSVAVARTCRQPRLPALLPQYPATHRRIPAISRMRGQGPLTHRRPPRITSSSGARPSGRLRRTWCNPHRRVSSS